MIRIYAFAFLHYLVNWTKHHWRTVDRITFLQIVMFPFKKIWEEWEIYRDLRVTAANVSNQDMSLEWYLNHVFNNGGTDIYIETAQVGGVSLGIDGLSAPETAAFEWLGDDTLGGAESAAFEWFPNPGEDLLTGTASFAVYVPIGLAAFNDAIKGVVNNYRLAGKTFIIINF